MELNFNNINQQYQISNNHNERKFVNNFSNTKKAESDKELQDAVSKFTAIFLNQMFKSMRSTVPESKLVDGGFAEDVFTEMLDQEISQIGSKQSSFSGLNEVLFRQLSHDNN